MDANLSNLDPNCAFLGDYDKPGNMWFQVNHTWQRSIPLFMVKVGLLFRNTNYPALNKMQGSGKCGRISTHLYT